MKRKRNKIYGLFNFNHEGKLIGFVEKSFSMSWSETSVRVWLDYKHADYYLRKYTQKDPHFANNGWPRKFFIARLNSKKCPVEIEWKGSNFERKFDARNAKFTLKNQ